VPRTLAPALAKRCYYFVPLVIAEGDGVIVAPNYTVDLGDRAICHRNVTLGSAEAVFSPRAWSKTASAWPSSSSSTSPTTSSTPPAFPKASPRSPGRRPRPAFAAKPARTPGKPAAAPSIPVTNEKGRSHAARRARPQNYEESAFSDSLAIYMLSLSLDFDYHDLREREYPLLAAPALAERLRHVASLFPANDRRGYEFQILYRRKVNLSLY
jgi:hypothetical protein